MTYKSKYELFFHNEIVQSIQYKIKVLVRCLIYLRRTYLPCRRPQVKSVFLSEMHINYESNFGVFRVYLRAYAFTLYTKFISLSNPPLVGL